MSEAEPAQTDPILVAGATSLIGGFLLERAKAEGRAVTPLSRRPGRGVAADLTRPHSLPAAERMICLTPLWLLAPALPALADGGLRRLVAFSSTSRFTKAASPAAEERAVADKLARAEADLVEICAARGIAWTVLRPTLIYVEGADRNVSRLAELIRRFGLLPLSGDGRGRRQPVHADDLAAAALAALDCAAAENRAYDLPGGETLTYRHMCERLFEALGRPPRILAAPPWAWRAAFALAGPLLPGATAAMGARMAEDLVFDAEPARRDFGYAPRPFRPNFGGR